MRTLLLIIFIIASSRLGMTAPIEIGSLVKRIITEQNSNRLAWSFLANKESSVSWKTQGIDYSGERVGLIQMSVCGFIPQVLKTNAEPAPWTLKLVGDKFGVQIVKLSNDGCFGSTALSNNCLERLTNILQSIKQVGMSSSLVCEFGPGGSHTKIYMIEFGKLAPLFLEIAENGGSGGMYVDVNLYIKSNDSGTNMEHATAICAILFAQNSGEVDNVYYSYSYLISR